jgi:hypothetical protein
MNNPKLVSIRMMLLIFSGVGMIVGSQVSSVLAQGNTTNTTAGTPTSTVATFTANGADSDALKDTAKAAREGALRVIDNTVKGFLTKNTTETANTVYSDDSGNGTQSLKGLMAIKDMVKAKIDSIIRESNGASPLSFKLTVGTECKPSNTDCIFKINVQKQ